MPAIHTILLFMAAALALNVTPGPSILYVVSRSIAQGRIAGLVSALGLGAGSLIHATIAALGVSAVLAQSPAAHATLRYLGAGYLVYLGVRMLLLRRGASGASIESARTSLSAVFFQGMLTELLNPKIVLFFLSFLPQFVDPSRGSLAGQTLFFGLLFHVTAVPVNLLVAWGGGTLSGWLSLHPLLERIRNALAGVVLIGLGARLALGERRP